MLKQIATASVTALTALTPLTLSSLPIHAQTQTVEVEPGTTVNITNYFELDRAKNLARQAAEKANGGLGAYRAEPLMHGPASASSYVDNRNGTWTFTFKGRRPESSEPTIESVVTVSTDGRVSVDYNGAIRSTAR